MGACVSRQQIVRTVASPLRAPFTESNAPESPPDGRLAAAVDLPGKAKDHHHHHPFLPHETVTPDVFSARSSTDGENSITEGDAQASALCQTSTEPTTFKTSEASMQPGSFPDKFHDASDVFESSLDFPLLNSENSPIHEIGSEKDRIQPPTCTSFTHRETMKEKSIEENKQEPLQTIVTLQRLRKSSSAEETNSETAEHDHLIQHEAETSATVSTSLAKHSNVPVESIVESNKTEQESRMVLGKETLLQMKEKGLAEPDLTTDISNKEDLKIYEPGTDTGTSETPIKTGNPKLVEQPAMVEENFEETDTDQTTRKDGKIAEQTASVEEWKKGSEIVVTFVAATTDTFATRDSEKSLGRSASSTEKQHKELETDLPINATTKTDQTLATIDVAQAAPTEAAEKGFQGEQPSSNQEAPKSLKLQITEVASSLGNEACQQTKDDSHAAIQEIEPNSQKPDIHNDQSKESQEGWARDDQSRENQNKEASVVPEQAAVVKQIIDSKDLRETKGDSSQEATPKPPLEFQRLDQGKGIPEKALPINHSGNLDLNEQSTDFEISKIVVTGNDLIAADQTTSIENHQGQADTAGLPPADELDQAETIATKENLKALKQTASIEEHQEESEPAGTTSNKAADPTQALIKRANVQIIEQPVSLGEKHQVLETIPAINMEIETIEPLTSWNHAEEVESDPATNAAIETAKTPITRDDSKMADAMAPLEEQCAESQKDPNTNSTIKTIGSLAVNNAAQSADPTAAKEEWLDEVGVAPTTNAATESAEILTTRDSAQISNQIVTSQKQQKESYKSRAVYATTVSVLGSNTVKENISVVELESSNVENSKEPEHTDSTDQQSFSFPSLQECREKSHAAQTSQGASATVQKLTAPSNEEHKGSETTPATDVKTDTDIVLINTVANRLNIVGVESGNDENVEQQECKNLGQQQITLSPLDEQHEKIDTVPATSATEEQQEESNTTPAVGGTTEPDVAPSDAVIKDAQAVELEYTNAGHIEKQQSTYVDQQPAVSSQDLKEPQEEIDIVQTTSAAAEIAKPLATKDDVWIANQTVPSKEKHEESGAISATTSTTKGDVVPIHWVRDTTVSRNEQHRESETAPDIDATTGTDVLTNTLAMDVNIVGLQSSNNENIEELESIDVDQQQTVSFPSLDTQHEKSDTAAATSGNEEQQEESTMEPDVATLDAIINDAQSVELGSTNGGNAEKHKSAYIDQQQTVSPPALKEQEQFDIFQTTSTAEEIDKALATKDDAQIANPVVPSEEQHEESSTIPATNLTNEADVAPVKAVTDPIVPRNEQHREPETTTATDGTTDTSIVLTNTVAEGVNIVGLKSSNDKNLENPEKTDVDQQQTGLFSSLDERSEKSEAAPATSATEEQHEGSNETPAIHATTVTNVAAIDGVTKDAQAVELQSTNAENAEKQESTHIDQQQALQSPALKEPQEEFYTVQNTGAAAEVAEPFVTKDDAQIANPIVPSEEQHQESGTTPATASTTKANVVPINVVTHPTVPSNEHHKQSETTPTTDVTTDADVVLINTVASRLNIVGIESSNDENVEEPASKDLGQEQVALSPLDEQHQKIDTVPATSATEEQQEESNTTPAVDGTTEPDVAPSDALIKDAQAVELEHTNAGHIEKQERTYVGQQPAVSSPDVKEPQEEFDMVQTTSAAAEIAKPLAPKDDVWIANQTVPSKQKHEESGTISATASTTGGNVVPIHWVKDTTVSRNEQHRELETAPDIDVTTGTDVLTNTLAKNVNIVGLESSNNENIEELESIDVDQQQTVSFPSLDQQHEKTGTAAATSANEEQQEESTMEPDAATLDAVIKDAQSVELGSTNGGNAEKHKSTYIDQQQTVSPPALKEQEEQFDIFQTTSTAEETDKALATKDDAQIANPVVPSEELHEESSTIPATNLTNEADVAPIKAVTDPTVPRNEQHKEPETIPATDGITDTNIVLTNTVAEVINIVGLKSSNDENVENPEKTDVDQQQTSLFSSFGEPSEKSEAAPAISATEEQQEGSNENPAIDVTTVTDVVATDGVTKDEQAVEFQITNAEHVKKQESTHIDQQQALSSPALKGPQEEFYIDQNTSAAAVFAEPFVTKDDAQIANPIVASEEQHQESGTTLATVSTAKANVVPINVVTDPTVRRNKQHKESATTAADATDVRVFIGMVADGANLVGLEGSTNKDVKEPESTYVDQQQTISFPHLDEQCENSDTAPATGPTEEQQKESNTTPAMDANTEPDVAPTDAVSQETQTVEHESTNGENVEKQESTYIDQQETVLSPALKEPQEQFGIVQTVSRAADIAEPLATKKQIANPTVPPEEQHEESDTVPAAASTTEANAVPMNALTDPTVLQNGQHSESKTTPTTDATMDTDVVLQSTVGEGTNIVGLENSNKENTEEPQKMDVDQEQITLSPSLDEQHEKSDTAPATSATEEQQEQPNTTPAVDAITEPDVPPFDLVTKDGKAADLEITNTENVEKQESTCIDQQQAILSPALKELQEEFDIVHSGSAGAEIADDIVHTASADAEIADDDAWMANQTMPLEEQHKASSTTPATASTTEANAVPISALTDPTVPRNEQHKESETTPATDATADTAVLHINTVREGVAIMGLEDCNDKNGEELESRGVDQRQTISPPSMDEQCESSGTTPAVDATTKPNVAPIDANTKDAQDAELERMGVENVEKQESTCIDEQQAVSSLALKESQETFHIVQTTSAAAEIAEALATKDDAHMANLAMPPQEQNEESGTTPATTSITEADVLPINVVTEDVKVVELERGSAKNVEEPESAVDKKQSVSFLALEKQYMAPATNIPTEIAEILPTGTNAQKTKLMQPMEEWYKPSDTTPVIDARTEVDDPSIGVEMEVVKAVELESSHVQNVEESKNTNDHPEQTVLFPAVERQQEDSDTTPVTDAITEADDVPIRAVTEELKIAGLQVSNAEEVAELKGTYDNLDVTVLQKALEEQHKDSDLPQATDTATENVGIIPSRSDSSMADPALSTEVQLEELDISPDTDTTREADAVPTNRTTEDVKFVKLKSSNIQCTGKSKIADVVKQPKVSLMALEEQLKESDITPATSAAKEIAEAFLTRDTAQMSVPIIPREEQYEEPISNQVINATTETNIDTVTEDAQVVELLSNNPEHVEDPESADVDQKQRATCLTLKENCEESETANATNAAKVVAEILPRENDVQIPEPKVPREEQQEESNTTSAIGTTIKADGTPYDALTKDVNTVEVESGNGENAEPKCTGNELQQTASFPVFDEQHKKTHTTPASDAMIKTDLPVDHVIKDVNVVEFESTNAKNGEEPGNARVDQCQKIFPPNLEELHENSHTAPSTSATSEIAKDLPTRNNVGMVEPTVPTKEQHNKFETTPAADATTGIVNVAVDTVILDGQAQLKYDNTENVEGPRIADIDNRQDVLAPTLKERSEETGTDQALNAATTIANTLPTRDNQWRVDSTASTTEEYEASTTIPAPNPPTAAVVVAVNTAREDVKVLEHENSHAESVKEPDKAGIDQQQAISSAALEAQRKDPPVPTEEQRKELDRTQATDATTAGDNVAIDTIIQEASVVEFKTSNAGNAEGPDTANTHQKQLVSSPMLEAQGEEPGTDPAINAATEIADTLPRRDDEQFADPKVSVTEQDEEPDRIPAHNATTEIDHVPLSTVTENVKIVEREPNTDQQEAVSSPNLEPQDKESALVPATYATTKTEETLSTMGNAQRADPMVPIQSHYEESDTAPATDATTEGDVECINAITQVPEVLQLESGNAENIEQVESADLNQEQTVSSLALEEPHEESHTSPAADAATEITEMLPRRNDTQMADTRVSTGRLHEESNSNKDTNTTTEADIDTVTADTQVVEIEGNNSENVEDQMRADVDQKHSVSFPALEEKHEESEEAWTANTGKEIFEILPTRNDAQIEDPTHPTEQQQESDMTPAVDATAEADYVTYNAVALDVNVMEIECSNADNTEELKSTHIDQQAFSTLAFGKQHEESETTPTVDATTETHKHINPVIEHIKVVEFEDKANTAALQQSTDMDQHQTVFTPVLYEQHEESDIVPTTGAVKKIIKTLPARANTQIADSTVATEEQHWELDTTPASDATTDAHNAAIDTVQQISKSVEVKSSNAENAEWPESADIDKKQSVLCLNLEEQGEESHTGPAKNATTEIINTLPARDAQQTADLKVSMTEQHEESNTIPAPDATTEAEDVPINAVTEDIKVIEQSI